MEDEVLRLKISIEDWRRMYGKIFAASIPVGNCNDGEFFVWRRVSIGEFNKLHNAIKDRDSELTGEDSLCELCILYPYDFDSQNCLAGIPTTLSRLIIQSSGLGEYSKQLLDKYRAKMDSIDEQIPVVIMEVFSNEFPTKESVSRLSMDEALERFAEAEWVIKILRGIPLTSGEEEKPGMVKIKDPVKFVKEITRNSPADEMRMDQADRIQVMKKKIAARTMQGGG